MRALFLTSSLGCYNKTIDGDEVIYESIKCNNSNGFVDRLKAVVSVINSMVYIASNPDDYDTTDKYVKIIHNSLKLDGFGIKNLTILDHRFQGNAKEVIMNSEVVFLAGGNVPCQNRYFNEIDLRDILTGYDGVVIGQSAGSMNCSEVVYVQPEEDDEFDDPNFIKKLQGLGLINFSVMPHINSANEEGNTGHPTVMQMCLEDSYEFPHYGFVDNGFIEVIDNVATAFGETYAIANGKVIQLCKDKESIILKDNMLKM